MSAAASVFTPVAASAAEPPAPVAGRADYLPLDAVIAAIAARRDTFERERYVPRDVIDMLKRAGVYRAATPRRFGGDPLSPAQFLQIVERIAVADGSAAWVASFGSANMYLAALPLDTQAQIYADGPDQAFAGGLFPVQPAAPADGGWTVRGTWKFGSGCKGADWIGVGIASAAQAGKPRTAVFRARDVEIVENWDVIGLRGTGSHDLKVDGRFVPEAWTFVRGAEPTVDEPLYRYPALAYAAQVLAVVNFGLARAALDAVTAMADGRNTTTGAPQMGQRAYFRIALAKAEAKLRATRGFFYDATGAAWDTILRGDPVPREQASLLRLAATEAAQTGTDVVMSAYRLAGTPAIQTGHPLQRVLRDSIVVMQHAFLGEGNYDSAGSVLVGLEPFPGYL